MKSQKKENKTVAVPVLIYFSDSFVEHDWCTKGHVGCVLSGEMEIDFDGEAKHYTIGDGLRK